MEEVLKQFKIIFNIDDKGLKQGIARTQSTLSSFYRTANSLLAGFVSFRALQGIIRDFAAFNVALDDSAGFLGINAAKVDALSSVLKHFGGDNNSAITSLNSLNKALADARFGTGALIDANQRYGITFTDSNGALLDAEGLLESLQKQMQGFNMQTRLSIGRLLGLDDAMIRAFNNSARFDELLKKQKAFNNVTAKDIKISRAFSDALLDLKESWRGVLVVLSRAFLPLVTKITAAFAGFVNLLKEHKVLIAAAFAGIMLALTPLLAMMIKLAVATTTAFAPFIAAGAAVAAFALIVEDLVYYFKGWDSATGALAEKLPILKRALEFIRPAAEGIIHAVEVLLDWLKDPTWQGFIDILLRIKDTILNALQRPLDAVKNTFNSLFDSISSALSNNPLTRLYDKVKGVFSSDVAANNAAQAPVVNSSNITSKNYTITNNNTIQNSISSPTPQTLANQYTDLIHSVNLQRIQKGGK